MMSTGRKFIEERLDEEEMSEPMKAGLKAVREYGLDDNQRLMVDADILIYERT